MTHSPLDLLAANDPHLELCPEVELVGTRCDHSHAQRRCQQRGISLTKIRIALAYGDHENHHHHERWTLLARQLNDSPYGRFARELNGLQLVGRSLIDPEQGMPVVRLKTCKWNFRLRRH